ncbi:AI-2E family transporter [Thermococcus celer]|uniref:AI-2E family transporter n=1 Tax=Thermococcus celer Vu 13 = JCM 8558 TaxID=1293037 RepID=A0A218P051_THECE|nr:AI-2E family transporter [Thermococcus celer]ASI98269.1 AI-2E family transporter [Thermococcus celer Vu 13 = JCM 8558]
MKVEGAVWAATVLLIIYLAWRTVGPLITPIFFALILAYAAYPIHKRLSPRIGEVGSALALTVLIVGLGGLITFELLMVSVQVAASLYGSVVEFLGWLMNQPLPPKILDFLGSFSNQLIPKLSEYISKRAFSIPTYLLQLLVFLFTFYYALAFSREITEEIRLLIPERNRRLGEQILESLNKTLGALVRAWLVLNVMKGFLMTLGFIIFGVSDLYTAIVAGFLTFVFSFVPLFEGWMIWLIAGAYFAKEGMYLHAVGISLYGFLLVSPMPDYTVRPMMVAKDANLDETLVFIGMVGGTWAMGVKGLIIGPIVLNLLLVLLKEWKGELSKEPSRPLPQAPSKPAPRPQA